MTWYLILKKKCQVLCIILKMLSLKKLQAIDFHFFESSSGNIWKWQNGQQNFWTFFSTMSRFRGGVYRPTSKIYGIDKIIHIFCDTCRLGTLISFCYLIFTAMKYFTSTFLFFYCFCSGVSGIYMTDTRVYS